jgi:hypothetical protein
MQTPEEIERLRKIWERVTFNPAPVDHPAMCVQPPRRPKCNTRAERRAQLKQIEAEHTAHFHKKWAKLLCSTH